jgi:hypothetical protein
MCNCGSDCRPVEDVPHPAQGAEKLLTVKEVPGDNVGEDSLHPAQGAEKQSAGKDVLEDNMGEETQSLHAKASTELASYVTHV